MDVIHNKPLAESERAFSFSHIVVVNEATATTGRDIATAIFALSSSLCLSAIDRGREGLKPASHFLKERKRSSSG